MGDTIAQWYAFSLLPPTWLGFQIHVDPDLILLAKRLPSHCDRHAIWYLRDRRSSHDA